MRELVRTALVNRPPAVVFDLINDIASYPQFVPGCSAARVLEAGAQHIVARLDVKKGPLHTHFTTRNRLSPPHEIHMDLIDGPVRSLQGHWQLTPVGEGCRIELRLQFDFSNPLKATLLEPLLVETANQLVQAFVRRAASSDAPAIS